ncbi:MAG: gamma-glutamyl-gamma-aminobutyrate hydrolase family protein [Aggregatilineales bacterium]
MSRPLIGIVCGPHYENGTLFYGLMPSYVRSVAEAGGLPVLIVPTLDETTLRQTYERMDALLMAGGADVDPRHYGMEMTPKVYGVDPQRDQAELSMIRWAAQDDKPLFGICRGCQMMNVALGGTLYRDIPSEYPDFRGVNHSLSGAVARKQPAHQVDIFANSRLAAAMAVPAGHLAVNSMHHQAVCSVAPSLKVSALSEDGIIEAIELPQARFFIGVQWHPEELLQSEIESRAAMERLFKAFVEAARPRDT